MGHQTIKPKTGKSPKQTTKFTKFYVLGKNLCGTSNLQQKPEKTPKQPTKFTNFHIAGKNIDGPLNPETQNRKNLQNNQPNSQTFTLQVKCYVGHQTLKPKAGNNAHNEAASDISFSVTLTASTAMPNRTARFLFCFMPNPSHLHVESTRQRYQAVFA